MRVNYLIFLKAEFSPPILRLIELEVGVVEVPLSLILVCGAIGEALGVLLLLL